MLRRIFAAVALTLLPFSAWAQSSPGWTYGQVLTAAQWNAEFATKQDVLGFAPLNLNGGRMLGKLTAAASTTSSAGFNIAPGVAPLSPVDGDLWVTSGGLFVQIAGATVGPIRNGNMSGPSVSVVGDVGVFGTTDGSAMLDSGKALPSGDIVGTTDTQALTNKSIAASEVNSGTLDAGRMPAFTGDVATSAGSTATTIQAGAVTDSKVNAAAAIDSGKLQFVPSWASSVARTVTSKNMDIVNLADFMPAGQACDGTHDISAAIEAAYAALPKGGIINLPPGDCPIVAGATFDGGRPVILLGNGVFSAATGMGTMLDCSGFTGTSGSGCINIGDSDGSDFENMTVDGGNTMAAGTYLMIISNGAYQLAFNNMRFSDAPNGIWFKHSLGLKFTKVRFINFTGANIWLMDGISDAENTQEIGCWECTFSPGAANVNTSSLVMDGWAASVDFTDTYFGPGGISIWMKNTCGCSVDPSFLRIRGRGFENGLADSLRMDVGNHVQVNGTYIANDGPGYGIFQGPAFGEDLNVTGSLIRGTGASCIRLDAGYANITGNLLENCGRINGIAVGDRLTVTGASGVGGLGGPIVLAYSSTNFSPNGGDIVFVNSVGGTTEANGTWYIAKDGSNHIILLGTTAAAAGTLTTTNGSKSATLNSTLWGTVANGQAIWGPGIAAGTTITRSGSTITLSQAAAATGSKSLVNFVSGVSSFAHSWTSGGTIQLRTYGVQISGSASSVHVSANNIGTARSGTNNSSFAVYNDSADAVVQDNWMPGYTSSAAYQNNNPTAVFRDNPGQEQVDGCAVVGVSGAVSTGVLDFDNLFQIAGRKVLFTRQGGWMGGGGATTQVYAGGSALTASTSLSTSHVSQLLATPKLVDGTSSPIQVQAHVSSVSGSPTGMKFQACYVNMD